MVRSEISMITRFCCTSFSKSPASDAIVVSCFHLWRSLQRDFDAKPRCVDWASYSLQNATPSPLYPIPSLCIHGTHFPVASIVLSCHHRFLNPTSPCSTTWAPNGSGSSLSASLPFRSTNAIAPISVTQLHATESGHSIG